MSAERIQRKDYKTLSSSPRKDGSNPRDIKPLPKPRFPKNGTTQAEYPASPDGKSPKAAVPDTDPEFGGEVAPRAAKEAVVAVAELPVEPIAPRTKKAREANKKQKDTELLSGDRWLARRGHLFTYIGLYLFSIMVLFRPYELVPGLSFLSSTAFYFAVATLAIYLPSQLATEGNLTVFSTEV